MADTDAWQQKFNAAGDRFDAATAAFEEERDSVDEAIARGAFPDQATWDRWLAAKTAVDEASNAWTAVALRKPKG